MSLVTMEPYDVIYSVIPIKLIVSVFVRLRESKVNCCGTIFRSIRQEEEKMMMMNKQFKIQSSTGYT